MGDQVMILKTLAWASVTLILYSVVRLFYDIWWKPKSIEKKLKQQGIKGNSYKLLYGDFKEIVRITKEEWSKPMALNHRIVPRVKPFIQAMVQKYGKISLSWSKTRPNLIIADPELMRSILNDKNGDFQKPPVNPLVDLLTLGVSTLEGEKWSKRRRLITPAFHHHKLQGMMPAFLASGCKLVDKLKELVSPGGSCEVDMAAEFQIFSADVIARAAFGSSYEQGKKVFELQKEQVVLVMEAYQSIYFPGLRFVPTRKNKRRYKIDNEIKAILGDMIQKKEEAMRKKECGDGTDDDLLGLLIQCKQEAENGMSTEDLIEECKLFYFAGQETTANWLTWTLVILSMHPGWQEKAREEVLRVCGKRKPDLEILNHLKIVSMVLNEVLRLYPPVTSLIRHTQRTTTIEGMSVPAGVDISLPTILLHYDPKYWGDDAEEFKPERFAEGVWKASKDQNAFYPFGWGPRFCLGQSFAITEAKLALAMLLQHFSFELSHSYTHAPYTVITLQPQHGAAIILHRI
ncbi:cytochrome P450 CYP72A616-like isoform X1 [Rhododendron vialii]|uniref:cytochrome P450 CYP72A616-like isoform X1 n=1 Tax=Rhododendron vialii TaxID=182163 RepID=UPI00265F29C6|nr:cytochrome P450 CYP72A616-like isoform X1 [Rhododendron vialii]